MQSEPGRGATFQVYLPQAKIAPSVPVAPADAPPDGGHETILLAEDESGIRAMTRAYLETMGYRVLEAADGSEAIGRSMEYNGPIHLVITDLIMPGIRGDSAVKAIRTQRPFIKAILMTGYADQDLAQMPESILHKPFELPELGRRVRTVLDARAGETGHHLDPAA